MNLEMARVEAAKIESHATMIKALKEASQLVVTKNGRPPRS
jgi:hypothetical protein